MSPKNPSLAIGLAALGLLGTVSLRGAAWAQNPAPGTTTSAAPRTSVLLLYNGRVVEGHLSEDDRGYVLKQKLGVIRFPKRDVEKIFGSLPAVYQYKASRLAEHDPDEHMKLAKWCLTMKLKDEAREQLQAVTDLSPGFPEAAAMMKSLDAADERESLRRDEQVLRTSATMQEKPDEINPAVLGGGSRSGTRAQAASLGTPQIFDLPPALAVRRTQEFAQYVHPELQKHCIKCHNEQSKTDFQLIQAKTRREMVDQMIIRANLDATLRLVDQENLAQSPLLTNSLMPHKPTNKPILMGPKSQAYRYFATWVYSLQSPSRPTDPAVTAAIANGLPVAPQHAETQSGFASERPVPGSESMPPAPPARSRTATQVGNSQMGLPESLQPPADFGVPENLHPQKEPNTIEIKSGTFQLPPPPQLGTATDPPSSPSTQSATSNSPPKPTATPTATGPQTTNPGTAATPTDPNQATPAPKKSAKKKTVDPNALEKFLINRNSRGS
ncbi:MAG TPA: hypothetical protein VGZ22_31990 [Isosphaeraceae bacterium]|jgi:hypothetical protein|nr:hypothetical protein [Isosphaeraceae bacterium]